jgi:peptidoglycan hydrolase-like protein with peptidoglycan-binding domain
MKGDIVVWAQKHLVAHGHALRVDGVYGTGMARAVSAFQTAAGLTPSGSLDPATWQALRRRDPAPLNKGASRRVARRYALRARRSGAGRADPFQPGAESGRPSASPAGAPAGSASR